MISSAIIYQFFYISGQFGLLSIGTEEVLLHHLHCHTDGNSCFQALSEVMHAQLGSLAFQLLCYAANKTEEIVNAFGSVRKMKRISQDVVYQTRCSRRRQVLLRNHPLSFPAFRKVFCKPRILSSG